MLSGLCPASFGVLFCSLVLGCRYTPLTTGLCSLWCPVSNWGVFECDITHRRSVAVLCVLYKIRCNPVHSLNGALPGPYLPVQVTCGALVAHWYTYAPPRCRTSQYSRLLFPSRCSSGTILLTQYLTVWDWGCFKTRANAFILA